MCFPRRWRIPFNHDFIIIINCPPNRTRWNGVTTAALLRFSHFMRPIIIRCKRYILWLYSVHVCCGKVIRFPLHLDPTSCTGAITRDSRRDDVCGFSPVEITLVASRRIYIVWIFEYGIIILRYLRAVIIYRVTHSRSAFYVQ